MEYAQKCVSLQPVLIKTEMKIALIGYGKMGKMIEETARSRGHEIVSIIDIDNQQDFESEAFRSADVAIEFTSPQAAYVNYQKAWAQGVKVVSGSTGWLADHEADVRRQCEQEGKTLFWASNFSVGVAIFSAVNRYLARIMNAYPQYDVKMEETHHIHKLDHPSGTAITLAEDIIAQLDRKWDSTDRRRASLWVARATCCASTASAAMKCRASTASFTTRPRTRSPSPTMPTRAAASPSVPCWLPSTPSTTKVC